MEDLGVQIGFYFPRCFIPRGHRTARTEWFRGEGSAAIRVIGDGEARLAFRVRFPPRLPRNPKFRERHKDYRVPATELELLSYDGGIWWPYWTWHEDFSLGGEFSIDQLRQLLEEDADLCHLLPTDGSINYESGRIAIARTISRDDEGRFHAIAADKVRANFLIYEGKPYVRGGVPLYVKDWIKSEKTFKLTVGDTGADRTLTPAIGSSFCYQPLRRAATFRSGDFWLATDRSTAVASACAAEDQVASIEAIAPDLVEDIRVQVRLDAIYRATVSIFRRPPRVPRFIKRHSAAYLDRLAPGNGPSHGAILSSRRNDALSDVLRRGIQYEPLRQLEREFAALQEQFGLEFPLFRTSLLGPREELAIEDDDALARLAALP